MHSFIWISALALGVGVDAVEWAQENHDHPACSVATPACASRTIDDVDAAQWISFIDGLQARGTTPQPYDLVTRLITDYLPNNATVLDIGCETGKNAIPLLQHGHRVTLIDIAPNAIDATLSAVASRGLSVGVDDSIVGKIEDLDSRYGPFEAVVGTYVFSFLAPPVFEAVMQRNVLERVRDGGYFVGGFFGPNHAWAAEPNLTTMSSEALHDFLTRMGFQMCVLSEEIEETPTVNRGQTIFHTLNVIARKGHLCP